MQGQKLVGGINCRLETTKKIYQNKYNLWPYVNTVLNKLNVNKHIKLEKFKHGFHIG